MEPVRGQGRRKFEYDARAPATDALYPHTCQYLLNFISKDELATKTFKQAKTYMLDGWDNGDLNKRAREFIVAILMEAGEKSAAAAADEVADFMMCVGQQEPPNFQLELPNFQPDFTRSGADDVEDVPAVIMGSSKCLGRLNGRMNVNLTACPANQSRKTCWVWDAALKQELRRLARQETRQNARTTSRVTR